MSVSAWEKERWPAQSSFWASLIMICVNCQAKAKEKKLDCSWSRLQTKCWTFLNSRQFSILFNTFHMLLPDWCLSTARIWTANPRNCITREEVERALSQDGCSTCCDVKLQRARHAKTRLLKRRFWLSWPCVYCFAHWFFHDIGM